jgi:hypothetical protein
MGYFVDEPPTVAHVGRGVVVVGCPPAASASIRLASLLITSRGMCYQT